MCVVVLVVFNSHVCCGVSRFFVVMCVVVLVVFYCHVCCGVSRFLLSCVLWC